jgi:hypothetical protein
MKEFMVSLDVETSPLSARQFTDCFGVKAKHFKMKKTQGKLLWRMKSTLGAKTALKNHIKSIFKKAPLMNSPGPGKRTQYVPFLSVGVMYDSYTCTVDLPPESIKLMNRHGVGIQVCCYPTDFEGK